MAFDWGQLLSTIGSVAGAVAPVAGGVLSQQSANTQGNQQNQILQLLLARAAQGVGPTGTTNAQGGSSTFDQGRLQLDNGALAPLQQLFQSVSNQALGTAQQSTEAAVLQRLRDAAMPQENIQANSVANRLFNTGRLGTTGGANILGQLSQAQQQADLQRQLAAGQESRTAQTSALQQALSALGGSQNISQQTLKEFLGGAQTAIGSTAAANAGLGNAAALTSNPNFNTSAGNDAIASILSGGLGGTGAGSGASGLLQQLLGGGQNGQPGLLQQLFSGGSGASGLGSLGGAGFNSWLGTGATDAITGAVAPTLAPIAGEGAGVAAGLAPAATGAAAATGLGSLGGAAFDSWLAGGATDAIAGAAMPTLAPIAGEAAGGAAAASALPATGLNLATLGPIGAAVGLSMALRAWGDKDRSTASGTTNPYAGLGMYVDGYGVSGIPNFSDPAVLQAWGAIDPNSGLRWEHRGGVTTYYNPDGSIAYQV